MNKVYKVKKPRVYKVLEIIVARPWFLCWNGGVVGPDCINTDSTYKTWEEAMDHVDKVNKVNYYNTHPNSSYSEGY